MQSNRLFEIIYILLNKKKITATELAQHFEVSRRTICRDIDMLLSAGIPIYSNKGRNGGICLMDNFILNKAVLSEQEQQDILSSLQGLNALKYPDIKLTLSKLQNLFCKSEASWIDVDFSHWGSSTTEQDKFVKIKNSIIDYNVITFQYLNSYGEISNRTVEPIQLWFKEKSWYLKAYCCQHNDYRIFKITRIRDIRIVEQNFTRHIPEYTKETSKLNYEIIDLKLKISKDISYRIYDEFDENCITKDDNGNFIVNTSFPKNDWIYGYILSFGVNVEVLEPMCVRNEILQIIDIVKMKYSC